MEIEMPQAATGSVPATGSGFASPLVSDSDPDCRYEDPRSTAQVTLAAHAIHLSSRRALVALTTYESDPSAAEMVFAQAMVDYKQRSGRMFPTWSEVLEILVGLGYQKATGDRATPSVRSATSWPKPTFVSPVTE
jgi:hypothetical protein